MGEEAYRSWLRTTRGREFAVVIQSLDQASVAFLSRSADEICHTRIRYPDPAIKVNDTVKISLENGKITEYIRFDTGVIAMATGGRNMGRVGVITHRERHDGGFNIVHIKDAIDNSFATREANVFVIGSEKPWVSLPKGKGVKVSARIGHSIDEVCANIEQLTIAEERDRRRAQAIAGH